MLLLNNDAVAEPGLAEALERAAAARPDAGLLACLILDEDGARCSTPARRSTRGSATPAASRRRRLRRSATSGRADGAAVAVSRAAADRVGLLDEALFLYVEDVDWSLRVRAAGFAVVLVPDALVRHKGSASTGGRASTTNLYYDTRNTIVVGERTPRCRRGLRGLRRAVVVGAHLAQAAPHPARRDAARAVLAGWRDARAGRLGQRSSR